MTVEGKTYARKYALLILVVLFIFLNIFLFYFTAKNQKQGLTFAMLDVGQGDALFIESPTGVQVLVDGGPPRKILGPLKKVMSPFDRSIDVLIITNPDTDHIGGFFDVIKNYKVGLVLEPGTINDSKTYQNLKNYIKTKNIQNNLATKGMRLDIGGGAVIDILFPNQDVRLWDSNEGSVVAKLTYGETSIMLTGDSTKETEEIILKEFTDLQLDSDILKVGHHGSRTSSSSEFVSAISPEYAFISNGKDNTYGHPHPDTLETLTQFAVKIFRTDTEGTIIMKSDGQKESFSFSK